MFAIILREVRTMVFFGVYVAIIIVLSVTYGDFWFSAVFGSFLFIFFLWPFAMLLDFFVEFLKVIFKK